MISREEIVQDDFVKVLVNEDDVEEEILPSTFIKSIPNKNIIWTTSVKNSLKF
jgi:hypothetical protein